MPNATELITNNSFYMCFLHASSSTLLHLVRMYDKITKLPANIDIIANKLHNVKMATDIVGRR